MMPGASHDFSAIQTPVELDLLARETHRRIGRSASPVFRFTLITSFLRRTEHLPSLWTHSYVRTFYPFLSAAIRHEYVSWLDPEDWLVVLRMFVSLREAEWATSDVTFAEARDVAWEKCCLCLAGMHAFRELHELLRAHDWVQRDLSAREWTTVLNAATVGHDPVAVYCRTLQGYDACPPFLLRAWERWKHVRADGRMPSVLLLDGAEANGSGPGIVLHLQVEAHKGTQLRVHFRNPLDENNTETMRQLTDAAHAATAIVVEHFRRGIPLYEWTVGFHEHQASYSGESMGVATALAMTHILQGELNRATRWELQPHLVCTGGIDATGQIRELPEAVVRSKVIAAFFSASDALVLPAAHAEQARTEVLRLQRRYPARRLDVHGVASIDACVAAPGIFRSDSRSFFDRTAAFTRRHTVPLLALLVLLLAAGGGYYWWKAQVGYPDLEFTLKTPIEESALVYNPRRADDWQFRDYGRVARPELPFGDLETGADATRNVYLWNMTPSDLDVKLAIEGPQADQWYLSWNGGMQTVRATGSLRVMVKYVPTRAAAANEAFLTVRDAADGELRTRLLLTGAAGPPLPGGYALRFDGDDDMLFFGEQAIAFARDEGTIEGWVRIDNDTCTLFSNTRNAPQAPAMANMALAFRNDSAHMSIGNNFSSFALPRPVMGDGRWHHFAVVFSREQQLIRFQFDGEVLLEKREEFIIEWVNKPYVTFGAYNNEESVQSPMRGALDELRVWDHALAPDTIRANMRRKVDGLSPGLVGYWDFDVVAEVSAHNANERTQDGQLLGRPAYIRSAVPLESGGADVRLVRGPDGKTTAIELQSCRWLQCGSDPIRMSPERSYAIRFRRDGDVAGRILTVMNQDAYIFLETTGGFLIPGALQRAVRTREGWNSMVARIDREQSLELFVNGERALKHNTEEFRKGPSHRYEGLQLGILNDKYNSFGPKPYDEARRLLRTRRALTDFRVWARRIDDDDILAYERGAAVPDGLVAHWPLDRLPDRDGNYRDIVGGHLMHLWKYRGWE